MIHAFQVPRCASSVVRCVSRCVVKSFLLIVLLLPASAGLQAQLSMDKPHEDYSVGLAGAYSSLSHVANFQKIPGYPNCCPHFESGKGNGVNLNVFAEQRLLSWCSAQLRLGYETLGGTLNALEQDSNTTITTSTGVEQARIEHYIWAHISNLHVEPMLLVQTIPGVWLSASLPVCYSTKTAFDQQEQLAADQDGVFTTGLRTRNVYMGEQIPHAMSLYFMARIGLRIEFAANRSKTVLVAPEVYYARVLPRVSSDIDWHINAVQAGISLRYNPVVPPLIRYDTLMHRDTVIEKSYDITSIQLDLRSDSTAEQEMESGYNTITRLTEHWEHYVQTLPEKRPYFLEASMKLKASDVDGEAKDIVTVKIEEVVGTSIQPLLPYVFFDEGSDSIPQRYNQLSAEQCEDFGINNLRKLDALELYRQVLNIIGRRLSDHPTASITITGCNEDMGPEKSNIDLSRKRAERVKNYFTSVWHINESRLKVKAQNLPNVASSAKSQDGIDENRRVEISSNDPEIMKNVVMLDTVLRAQHVSSLHFYPTVRSSAGVASWAVRSVLNDSVFVAMQGNTMPESHLQWDINKDLSRGPRDLNDIRIRFTVHDKLDSQRVVTQTFPVEMQTRQDREKVNDKYVDKYSLILYDFGSYTHTAAHLAMIKYIKEHSNPKSTFVISGHTDRSGSAEYNMMLSTKRAEYTAKALNLPLSTAKGYGKEQELYDNSFPEGRMYNRTVNIVVETPVEQLAGEAKP